MPIKTINDQNANFEETDFGEKPTKPEAKREKTWQIKDMRMQGEHRWQDTLTSQNEAVVTRGRQDLSEYHESSGTIADESESNLVATKQHTMCP